MSILNVVILQLFIKSSYMCVCVRRGCIYSPRLTGCSDYYMASMHPFLTCVNFHTVHNYMSVYVYMLLVLTQYAYLVKNVEIT